MKRLANYLIAMAVMAFTFTSCEDVPSPFGEIVQPKSGEETVTIEPTGSGTEADPYNVAAALEVAKSMSGDDAAKEIVAKGYISSIDDMSTQYGNCTYYISDNIDGTANKLMVYRGYGLNGDKFTTGNEIKQGDLVVVKGGLVNFKGNTPEFTTGSMLLSINGQGGGNSGGGGGTTDNLGTKDAPLTIAQALEIINKLGDGKETDSEAYVKGKVVKVTTSQANFDKYGNLNYLISEDGNEANTITVYSGDGLNKAKFTSPNDLAQGDEVVVCGKLYKYVNNSTGAVTPEINKGNYLVSLVKGSGGGGNETPSGEAKGSGTLDDPYNAAAINQLIAAMPADTESTQDYYIKGKVVKFANKGKFEESGTYGNASFYISDDGKETSEQFYVFRTLYLGNEKWTSGVTPAVGDEVVICGKVVNYKGNTPETVGNKSYLYSLNGKTESGGGDTGGNTGGDTGGDFDITAEFANLDCSNLSAITLSDGTVLDVEKEDGKSAPIYHESTQIIRIYACNSISVNAGNKKIAKVQFSYDTYNGTAYKGNDEMYGEAGGTKLTPAKDDATVTFTNVNNSILKVVNWLSTGNSGGVQFRITKISIKYAN